MADPVRPRAKLVVGKPNYDGMVTEFGLSRDWRFDENWEMRNGEFIEPLNAFGPAGDARPVSQSGQWNVDTGYNNAWTTQKVRGNPVCNWMHFYDGSVHAEGTAYSDYVGILHSAGTYYPNIALHTIRQTPPENQGVRSSMALTLHGAKRRDKNGQWQPAHLNFALPLEDDEFHNPFLHIVDKDDVMGVAYNILTTGRILSQGGTAGTSDQGMKQDTWLLETVQDTSRFQGTHVLIRNTRSSDWWHFYSDKLRIDAGTIGIAVQGAKHWINVRHISYGNYGGSAAYAWARHGVELPVVEGSPWNGTTSWDSENSNPGWTVSVGRFGSDNPYWNAYYDVDKIRPRISCSGTGYRRPIVWFVSEQHDAVISNADTTTSSTDGNANLKSIEYTQRANWRGCTGTAEFFTEQSLAYSDWMQNGKVEVYLGMDQAGGDTYDSQVAIDDSNPIATGYLTPGGMTRERSGDGPVGGILSLEFGDFAAARLPQKRGIPDWRQAGGMSVNEWANMVGNRLGLPASMISVGACEGSSMTDAQVQGRTIPTASPIPSEPAFELQDGGSVAGWMDEVCNSVGFRWGFDKDGDGKFFVDNGPPTWSTGDTPDYILDDTTANDEDYIYTISKEDNADEWRNALKVIAGRGTLAMQYYDADTVTERQNSVGDDWWSTQSAGGIEEAAGLVNKFFEEHRKYEQVIVWTGIVRPGLRVDDFVKVSNVDWLDIADDTVFQIIEHSMRVSMQDDTAESTITGVVVS